ncbi:hypothetical protein [Paenibacillus protaetiae]|uniref:Uncharacterized protein n=1 Tax=Paenibacillus protaetiae TaxID=2509456 RepID=A0A4P6EVS3_9BACL|nr:hypothetical protein [Paenibacillus protaetiae]QAY67400.1 hypothetical protein ET464_14375 [Paenibacillus protaetiae]
MGKSDELRTDPQQLAEAWQHTLPDWINEADSCTVVADESDNNAIRVTVHAAGHQMYSFDFKVTYVDSREVKAELVDVEKDGVHVDERTDIIQELIADYTRHLHECAQALHQLTHV